MPDFHYTARERSGREITGTLSAGSESEAAIQLSSRQLFPVRIQAGKPATSGSSFGFGKRVSPKAISLFYNQLSDLLQSGVPLLRSLQLLERQTRNALFTGMLKDIRQQVADGTRLADSMGRHPEQFDDLATSIVRAGEEGGFLEDVLRRLALFTEHQQELRGRVLGAVAYPLFLLVFGTLVVAALVIWFVPKFEPIFRRMESDGGLPVPTRMLLGISDFFSTYGIFLILPLLLAGLFASRAFRTPEGRARLDRWRISTPVAGTIYRSLAISRFCRIFGTLLKNGVPILPSLRIAKDATGNIVLRDAIASAADNLSQGESLVGPFSRSGQFPTEIVEMIAVGEEANNLDQVLVNIAESLEKQTWRQLDLFVRLLEPVMLLLMAAMVLFVVVALMLPIFQSSGIV